MPRAAGAACCAQAQHAACATGSRPEGRAGPGRALQPGRRRGRRQTAAHRGGSPRPTAAPCKSISAAAGCAADADTTGAAAAAVALAAQQRRHPGPANGFCPVPAGLASPAAVPPGQPSDGAGAQQQRAQPQLEVVVQEVGTSQSLDGDTCTVHHLHQSLPQRPALTQTDSIQSLNLELQPAAAAAKPERSIRRGHSCGGTASDPPAAGAAPRA